MPIITTAPALLAIELRKLVRHQGFYLVCIIIPLHMVAVFFASDMPEYNSYSGWLNALTQDGVIMEWTTNAATLAIFTSAYAKRSFQELSPDIGVRKLFWIKVLASIIALLSMLLLWHMLALLLSLSRGSFDAGSLYNVALRLLTQFPLILFGNGITMAVGAITRSEAVTGFVVTVGYLLYTFIPVYGLSLHERIITSSAWGAYPNFSLCAFLAGFFIAACLASGIIFEKRKGLSKDDTVTR